MTKAEQKEPRRFDHVVNAVVAQIPSTEQDFIEVLKKIGSDSAYCPPENMRTCWLKAGAWIAKNLGTRSDDWPAWKHAVHDIWVGVTPVPAPAPTPTPTPTPPTPKVPPPGTVIKVRVGGVEYETIIDTHGVQRFRTNTLLRYIVDNVKDVLNRLGAAYQTGYPFTQREYLEFYIGIGYSVSGLSDLSFFQDMEIENPLWDGNLYPMPGVHVDPNDVDGDRASLEQIAKRIVADVNAMKDEALRVRDADRTTIEKLRDELKPVDPFKGNG